MGTVESYWKSHIDLLDGKVDLQLDDPGWPILTWSTQRPPARVAASAQIEESLISPGCDVRGRVVRSVVAPGVVVEEGAVVSKSILLHDTVVRSGSRIEDAIIDAEVEVGEGARVGREDDEITLVGQRARVAGGTTVAAGEPVEPAPAAPP